MDYTNNETFAMLFGLILGDGWLSKNHREGYKENTFVYHIGVAASECDLHIIRNDCIALFGDIGKAKITTKTTCSHKYGISGTTSSFVMNTRVAKIFEEYGMPTGSRVEKEFLLPDWLVEAPGNIKRAFISGLYAAEGDNPIFQKNDKTLKAPSFVLTKVKSLSKNFQSLVSQISGILKSIGIEHTLFVRENFTKYEKISVEFVLSNNVDNISYFTSCLDLKYCQAKKNRFLQIHEYYKIRQAHLEHRRKAYDYTMSHKAERVSDIAKRFGLSWSVVGGWRKGKRTTPSSSRVSLQKFSDFITSSPIKNPLNGEKLPARS